ncbi:MAG: peptidylprolyl isomerase [Thermoguttaceae bacterium]|jgi:parvulin-like peptidyl-prolyl isomerase
MNQRFSALVWLIAILSIAAPAFAQREPAGESAIAATVGDDPVEVAEAQRMMDSISSDKKPTGDLRPIAQALMLEEIVNRRLVLAYARRVGDAPNAEELAKAKKELQIRLAAQGRKVSDVLKSESITAADLERQVLWRLVWDRYLAKYRTPQRRETWFQKHHNELDGTELVVSHVLLRPAAGAGLKEIEGLEKQAESIRAEIASGKIDFAAAARKYSTGPSGKQGGRLGKIGRDGPQDEPFSRAAFRLQAGEISPPVRSQFGVHLIRCDEVLPGTKKLSDLIGPIDNALAKELLERISQRERQQTPVKYTSAWPHFKPGTRELAK